MAQLVRENRELELIVENAREEGLGDLSSNGPMVLSCGGIFVPRPRPGDPLYQILNIPNSNEPTKVVSGSVPRNILQEVLHKESMN